MCWAIYVVWRRRYLPDGAAGKLVHGAAGRRVRNVGSADVGRDGVLGFAFTDDGGPGVAGGAGVLQHFPGGGSGEDVPALSLAVDLGACAPRLPSSPLRFQK